MRQPSLWRGMSKWKPRGNKKRKRVGPHLRCFFKYMLRSSASEILQRRTRHCEQHLSQTVLNTVQIDQLCGQCVHNDCNKCLSSLMFYVFSAIYTNFTINYLHNAYVFIIFNCYMFRPYILTIFGKLRCLVYVCVVYGNLSQITSDYIRILYIM